MKAKLEFELPEDQYEFEVASNAHKYKRCLEDFDNYLRSRLKYETIQTEEIFNCLQEVRNKLHEIIEENEAPII
jgi:hypothetical protein